MFVFRIPIIVLFDLDTMVDVNGVSGFIFRVYVGRNLELEKRKSHCRYAFRHAVIICPSLRPSTHSIANAIDIILETNMMEFEMNVESVR